MALQFRNMRRILPRFIGGIVLVAAIGSGIVGWMFGSSVLQPTRRALTAELIERADEQFRQLGATREDLTVRASDGILLQGWKVRPREPNADWVMLFHGQSDNRVGMLGQASLLLHHGYSLVMMDARAHGASQGRLATYGWLERHDTQAVVDALYKSEHPGDLFALGSSMGAAIALQSAAVEPRIAGVVAESSFSDLREVSYDYAGLHWSAWLGKTLFRPGSWTAILAGEERGGFPADEVSPEEAVAERPFPVLLICDLLDMNIPCRHSEHIFQAALGQKQLWEVPLAGHAAALGASPVEYERRVLSFLESVHPPPFKIDNP